MCRTPKKLKQRNGVAAVEFAMVLPVFVLVIIGAMELCNLNIAQSVIINKAREAARLAINTNADGTTIRTTTQTQIASMLRVPNDKVTVSLTATAPNGSQRSSFQNAVRGDLVKASVSLPYSEIAFFASNFMGPSFVVSDDCIMQKE
jgi:Flp pilus assembly protein TadG